MKKIALLLVLIITLIASFALFSCGANKEHTVSFESNGGTKVESVKVKDGEKVAEPICIREQTATTVFELEYWYESDENVKFNFNTAITKDTTLKAKWKESVRKYTVIFKNYDNTFLQTNQLEYNAKPNYIGNTPVKDLGDGKTYVFTGWDRAIENVTCDTVYVAQFSAQYTITFELKDGAKLVIDSKEVTSYSTTILIGEAYDFSKLIPTNLPSGKTFYGWEVQGCAGEFLYKGTWNIESDITVCMLYTAEYTPYY